MNRLAGFSLIPGRWSVDLTRVSARVINLGLVVLLAYGLVQLMNQLQPDKGAEPPIQSVPMKSQGTDHSSARRQKISEIPQLHLFGKAEPVSLQAEKIANAPDTKLNLILRGIYFPDTGEGSIAIIQDATKQEQPFVIGDAVFKLATLEQIHIDRVILLRNGKHETLRLPKKSLGLVFEEDPRVVASKTIQEFRNDFLTGNMEKYVYHIDYDTVYDENGFAGFKVIGDSDKGKEILRKIGLEDGDIVVEIDGIDLLNDLKMIDALRNLRTAEMVNIALKRGGATIRLTLDFTQK